MCERDRLGCIRGTLLVAQLFEALARREVAGSIPDRHNPSGRTMTHGYDSASNRNEYQEYFLGEQRRPVGRADNLTTFMCRLS
jgi:hypothetical protein